MNLNRDILFQRFDISNVKQKLENVESIPGEKKSRHKMGKTIRLLFF
jgi:hypothetical protein